MKIKTVLSIVFGFLSGVIMCGTACLHYYKPEQEILITPVETKPLKIPKQHKFHYQDEVVIINGFYKGLSGDIIGYSEIDDTYIVLTDDPLGFFTEKFFVKDNDLKLKNKEDELVDFFSNFTNEELMKIATRKQQEVIGLTGVTIEKAKRQDAKAAKEELARRGISIKE